MIQAKRKFSKILSVLLSVLLIIMTMPGGLLKVRAADDDGVKTTLSISDGSIVIGDGTVTQNGKSRAYNANGYIITGSGTTLNTIRVTSGKQNIALVGVNIDVSSKDYACAFSIASGAAVNLTLSGKNTLKSGTSSAGLEVPKGASIFITGTNTDSLTARSGLFAAGIGGGDSGSGGDIVICGGTVNATSAARGAGIGGGYNHSGGNVTITGGSVTATGNIAGAGIGGDDSGSGGNIIITGGTVTATGSWSAAGIGGGDSGSGGNVAITGGTVTATSSGSGAGIGGGGSAGTTTITGGSVHSTVQGTVTDGNGNTEHCVTVTGLTDTAPANASINGGKTFVCQADTSGRLYLWMAAGNDKSTICCSDTYYGANATVSEGNISTAAGKMAVLDMRQGNITISDGSVTGKDSDGHDASVNAYGYVITTSVSCGYTSTTVDGGTHNIVLKNVNVNNTSVGQGTFSITGSSAVNLTLSGINVLKSHDYYAGIEVGENASLSITGRDNDCLEAYGGYYAAGIGGNSGESGNASNCGTVNIAGGSIKAVGNERGAGIGGGSYYGCKSGTGGSGGKITISGGSVTAIGGSLAAGIGGGCNGSGNSVTITGGIVTANSGNSAAGIGDGYGGNGGSTVKITGGSVSTPSISGTPTSDGSTHVYPTTVTLLSGTDVSSLSITQGSPVAYGINDMRADNNETLHLYLPASVADDDTKVNVTAGGTAYSGYHGTIKTSGTNALKMDQSTLTISGLSSSYTYGDAISPSASGGTLSGTPKLTYSGNDSITGSTITNSSTQPTDVGNYKVTATKTGNDVYYDGTVSVNFSITPKSLTASDISVEDIPDRLYTGNAVVPTVTVKDGTSALVSGRDYVVSCSDSTVGTATAVIMGNGNYIGKVNKDFIIEAQPTINVKCASGNSLNDWASSVALKIDYTVGSSGLQSITVSRDGGTEQKIQPHSDGTYQYTLTENGTYIFIVASESGFTASQTVTEQKIDTAAPTVSSISGNPVSPVQSASLRVTATPGVSGIKKAAVSRSIDGGEWVQVQNAQIEDKINLDGSHTYTYTSTMNGTYKFTVTSVAGVSTDSSSADIKQIDTISPATPTIDLSIPTMTSSASIMVTGTAEANSTVTITGGVLTATGMADGNGHYNITVMLSKNTENNLNVTATDAAGNISEAATVSILSDTIAPGTHQITIASKKFTTFLNTITFGLLFKNTQIATVTAADSGSGVASIQYQLVHAQSNYDENGTWTTYPSGGINLNPDNKYIVYAKITDNAGNSVIVNSDGVIVDQTSPALTILAPSGWQTDSTYSVGVTASDNLAGVQSVLYTTNETMPQADTVSLTDGSGRITLTNEGDYTLAVIAMDNAGNAVSRTAHIQWDKTRPSVAVSGNPVSLVQSAKLSVTATAGVSSIKSVTVSKDNGPEQNITDSYQSGYTVTQNGIYIFTVTNNAGVKQSSSPVSVTQIDAAKPVVQINSNGYASGTWTKQSVKLDVSNQTENLGTTTFESSTDSGKTWTSCSSSLTDSTEGVTAYSFRAKSQSGVVGDMKTISVKIDKTAPVDVAIKLKQNPFKTVANFVTFNLFFGDTVDVSFSAGDTSGSGVDHYEYQTIVKGGTFDPSGIWQTGSLSLHPDFKGTIYARAVDQAGNVSGYVTKSLVIDKTAPVITAQSALITNGLIASIPVTVKDNGAGVGSVSYQINGGTAKIVNLTTDSYSDLTKEYSFNISDLPDGIYDVTVNAQDNSGNAATTVAVHVIKNAAQTGFGFQPDTLSKTYGDAPFAVIAAGGQSGGTVTYAVTDGSDILSVDAVTGKVTIRKAGTAVIIAKKTASSGYNAATAKLSVNVLKATPTVQALPVASGIHVIGKLSSIQLSGGKASVPGTFIWTNPNMVLSSSGSYAATFAPTNSDDYGMVSCSVPVTVFPLLTTSGSNMQLNFINATLPAGVTSISFSSTVQGNDSSAYTVVEKLFDNNKSLGNLSKLMVFDLSNR